MFKEINKPSNKQYWIAKNGNGDIVHVGIVEPYQVVTTSEAELVSYTNRIDFIKDIKNVTNKTAPFNYDFDPIDQSWKFRVITGKLIYLPVSLDMASQLNNALYQCIDPGGNGNYAEEIPYPIWPGYVLYQLNEIDIVPISLGIDPTPLQNALSIAVAGSGITQEEADQIVSDVQAHAGEEVSLISFIPPSWKPYIIDEREAIRLGVVNYDGV